VNCSECLGFETGDVTVVAAGDLVEEDVDEQRAGGAKTGCPIQRSKETSKGVYVICREC